MLASDKQIFEAMNKVKESASNRRWSLANIVSNVLPSTVSMGGSHVRIHLNSIEVPSQPSQPLDLQSMTLSQSHLRNNLSISQAIEASSYQSQACILQGLKYFAYIRQGDTGTISIMTESGFYLKFSLMTEDLLCLQNWNHEALKMTKRAKQMHDGSISYIPADLRMKI